MQTVYSLSIQASIQINMFMYIILHLFIQVEHHKERHCFSSWVIFWGLTDLLESILKCQDANYCAVYLLINWSFSWHNTYLTASYTTTRARTPQLAYRVFLGFCDSRFVLFCGQVAYLDCLCCTFLLCSVYKGPVTRLPHKPTYEASKNECHFLASVDICFMPVW